MGPRHGYKIKKKFNIEVDTEAYATIFPKSIYDKYFGDTELSDTNKKLNAYGGIPLKISGKLKNLEVSYKEKTRHLDSLVLPVEGPPLIGRQWLANFDLWPLRKPSEIPSVNKIESADVMNILANKYAKLFDDEPGLYNKSKTKIYLREEARPISLECRHVAHAIKPLIDAELDRLVKLGHLKPIQTSEWVTPIVPIFKSNSNIRICGDFKLTINPSIIIDKYPLHTIDDIFAKLQGACIFRSST